MSKERNCSTCDHWITREEECLYMGWVCHEWQGSQVRRHFDTCGNESCRNHTPRVKHPKQKRTRKSKETETCGKTRRGR